MFHQPGFGDRVERAGGFVEDQQRRTADQRPRDVEALALAAAKIGATLLDPVLIAAGQRGDQVVDAGVLCGALDFALRDRVVPEGEIVADAAAEQRNLLVDQRD